MKSHTRIILGVLLVFVIAVTFTACTSDGYPTGTSTVYVSHGYGGYGPGWGHGWGGYGGYGGGYYGPGW